MVPSDRYREQVCTLSAIARARLPGMIDPATGLVVFRREGPKLVPVGTSFRYTAMVAVGLERAEKHALPVAMDRGRLLEAIGATLAGTDNSGDLGLAIWATARDQRAIAERALRLLTEFDDIHRSRGDRNVHSTELAWVVTGLSEALSANVGIERDVRARLDRAFRVLLSHRGESGLVCFSRPRPGIAPAGPYARLRAALGFFDAQVYSIVAALRRDEVVSDPEAREAARRIGAAVIAAQHPLGQWAWHYNVRTGGVVDLYPVYSVHQDAMAPMALLPLERATGLAATPAVARGVEWLFGGNELGAAMADERREVLWRSIRRRRALRSIVYPLKVASLAGLGASLDLGAMLARPSMLEVDRETRPYHLGLCLYAFSELAASAPVSVPRFEAEENPTLKTGCAPASRRGSRTSNGA